jgi:MFS family permease
MELAFEAMPDSSSRPVSQGRLRITLFLATTGLIGLFQGISNILLPRAVEQLDPVGKVGDLAMMTTIAAIVTVFGLIAGGILSDRTRSRWGRRTPTIAVTCVLATFVLIAMGLAQSIPALIVLTPLLWLILAFYQAATAAMLPDRVPLEDRGKAAAAIALGAPAGLFISINLVALLPSTFAGYLALAGLFVAGTLCLLLFTPEAPALEPRASASADGAAPSKALFSAFRSRNFVLTFVSRALLFLSFFAVTGYLFYLVQDYIGVDQVPGHDATQAVSRLYSMLSVAWLVATPVTGYIADRVRHTPPIVGYSSIGIGLAILAPALAASWPAMLVFALGSGLFFGVYFAIDLKLMSLVLPDPETAGRDLGILGVATSAPQILTPAIAAGLIAIGGYQTLFAVGAILAIAGGIAALFIRLPDGPAHAG